MGSHAAPRGRAGRDRRFELERERRSRRQGSGRPGSAGAWYFLVGWTCYGLEAIQAGISNHSRIAYYLLSLVLWILLPIPGVLAIVLGERLAAASVTERPRWFYAVAGACLLGPAGLTLAEFIRLHGRQPSWLTNSSVDQALSVLAVFLLLSCTLMAVLMFGRALLRGPLRLRCWINQPRWLSDAQHVTLE